MRVQLLSSRDNPLLKSLKKLSQNNAAYKDSGRVWLEGAHLCEAYLLAAMAQTQASTVRIPTLQTAVLGESVAHQWLPRLTNWFDMLAQGASAAPDTLLFDVAVLPDALLAQVSGLPSSGGLGFVLQSLPQTESAQAIQPQAHTVVLDRIQDAGNVGSILRSAAAFGVQQVVALQGTAALWSPKVLRAGMGAHFGLRLIEGLGVSDWELGVPLLATHVHSGDYLHVLQSKQTLPYPCAWVMGHEGQGVSDTLLARANQLVRIAQVGQESLNVAAAAAVCLYASMPQANA